ncbi:hypothetical protein [Pseudomonas kuykendallii]|uniref:hypothetical protein n=1 Tax=Pseudomonas kuykendallii TaxID=1007099 RepID=UPI0030B88A9C
MKALASGFLAGKTVSVKIHKQQGTLEQVRTSADPVKPKAEQTHRCVPQAASGLMN